MSLTTSLTTVNIVRVSLSRRDAMPSYQAPLRDFRFLLREVFDYEGVVAALPGHGDAGLDLVAAVLESADRLSREVLLPVNLRGDAEGCTWSADGVRTPAGYRQAYATFCAGGWPSLAADPAYGGQGLPLSLALFVREIMASGSMAFGMYAGLSQGAYRAISTHGTDTLKQTYLPRLVDGSWTGTMCLTEAESGSDLSGLRTRAVPAADGSYRIHGAKIFISGGDHDLAENIVHLVLARLPDAPPGTKGISLFVVPKLLPDAAGSVGGRTPNGVVCTSIEHKMGIHGSATASLSFEGSRGWIVGEPHGGLRAMFTMMNASRLGVAVQSAGVAELSWQNALAYALERRQGHAPRGVAGRASGQDADPIFLHPDVRRTLLRMKSLVEGTRAMVVQAALDLDVRAKHPDRAQQARADASLALMTPVLKSFISDCAVEVCRLGMSIFGGHGYIHDNGMEQLLRDAAIVPLYEGTNGIQALDLVQRKLTLDEGRPIADFLGQVARTIRQTQDRSTLAQMGAELQSSATHLQEATRLMQADATGNPAAAAAGATGYLRLLGLVACGHAWLRMAIAAADTADTEGTAFYLGKMKTARFYMAHVLPETRQLLSGLRADASLVTDVAAEEL
jgi:alkylation response protein AidB-like acyl-CoA dehydrogenase